MPAGDKPGKALPGSGLWGWLGRQVGHVKTAVAHNPVADKPKAIGAAERAPDAQPQVDKPPADCVLYRTDHVEEQPHPTNPQLTLRRTVIDEVIVEKKES